MQRSVNPSWIGWRAGINWQPKIGLIAPALLLLACAVRANAEPEPCIDMAAQHYNINHEILSAVLAVEGGKTGMKKRNKNGSYDTGPMQINSSWMPELGRRGISEYAVTNDYCTNILVGAWILSGELRRAGDPRINTAEYWQAIGRYNSSTPYFNSMYAVRVWYQTKTAAGH